MIRRAFLLLLAISLPAPISAQLNLAACTIPEAYGTYAAQVYVRDFAQRVRTVSMKGVVPFGQIAPVTHASDGELAWRQLVARCAADVTCRTHYPTLDEDLRAIVSRLTTKAATLPVKQADGTPATIMLSAGIFGEIVRNMLYTPESAAHLPSLIRQVAKGDLSALGPVAVRTRNLLAGSDLAAVSSFRLPAPREWRSSTRRQSVNSLVDPSPAIIACGNRFARAKAGLVATIFVGT